MSGLLSGCGDSFQSDFVSRVLDAEHSNKIGKIICERNLNLEVDLDSSDW